MFTDLLDKWVLISNIGCSLISKMKDEEYLIYITYNSTNSLWDLFDNLVNVTTNKLQQRATLGYNSWPSNSWTAGGYATGRNPITRGKALKKTDPHPDQMSSEHRWGLTSASAFVLYPELNKVADPCSTLDVAVTFTLTCCTTTFTRFRVKRL